MAKGETFMSKDKLYYHRYYSTRPVKTVETLHFEHYVQSEVLQLEGNEEL